MLRASARVLACGGGGAGVWRQLAQRCASAFSVVNPATEEIIAELPQDSPDEAVLTKFATLLRENEAELASTLSSEMGKPISQSRGEVRATAARIRFFNTHAHEVLEQRVVSGDGASSLNEIVTYEPVGVVGNVSAWNYPYFVGANVFGAAMVLGNAVLYKASEHAALTGLSIARLMREAGAGEAFVGVTGTGETGEGAAVAGLRGLGSLFFTGSHKTGVKIATAAAPNLVKVHLELGGKDPVYIRPDADIASAAASTSDGAFYNAGQSCCAVERIYVHKSVYEEFVEEYIKHVRGFVIGDPREERTHIGPVARKEQVGFLQGQGGPMTDRRGYYFAPVSFGPVIGIQRVSDDDEAVALMGDTEYGLTAGVYSRDEEAAMRMLKALDVGTGYWNCCDRVSPALPWSGRKHSGVGSTLGLNGLRAMVRPKALHLKRQG
eukprot:jgi/Chlat1/397/Chrsp10S08630